MKPTSFLHKTLWPVAVALTVAAGAPRVQARDLSPAQNNAIAEKFFKTAWNKGDFDAVQNLLAPNVVDHSPVPAAVKGKDHFRAIVGMFRQAMPDVHMTIGNMVYRGDFVVHRWIVQGTQTGTLFGVPATHKHLVLNGITMVRMHNGQIAERWTQLDLVGLMGQLGYKMVPPSAATSQVPGRPSPVKMSFIGADKKKSL